MRSSPSGSPRSRSRPKAAVPPRRRARRVASTRSSSDVSGVPREGLVASLDASLEPAEERRATSTSAAGSSRAGRSRSSTSPCSSRSSSAWPTSWRGCRRWHVPLVPALRSYLRRLGFWVFVGIVFALFGLAGAWPGGDEAAINPASEAASHWPRLALALFALVVLAGWLVARARLVPEGPVAPEDEVAGMAVALLALAVVALVLIVTNPWGLLFVLPSAHAWLWLVQARGRGPFAPRVPLRARPRRPRARLRLDGAALRPRPRHALVPCGADCARVRVRVHARPGPRVDRGGFPGVRRHHRRYTPYPAPVDRPARGVVGTAIAALRSSWQRS